MPNPSENLTRRWTVIASGLLLSALALVVLYTGRAAFRSPLAVVVVAAIGMAAALFQVRLQRAANGTAHSPIWLTIAGVIAALIAVFADLLKLSGAATLCVALVAVGCFGVSGFVILVSLRKNRTRPSN